MSNTPNDYKSTPDVDSYAQLWGSNVEYSAPSAPWSAFRAMKELKNARYLGEANAPLNGSLPYTAPQLVSDAQLRWQLGVMLLGGFTGLLLYSYLFERPLFG